MKNKNLEKVEKLNVSEKAKDILKRIYRVASSENVAMKAAVKNLFVVCPQGAGLTEYARTYEEIIIENGVYPVRGKGTYLELAFPRMGREKDYTAFYYSPRLVAATMNYYIGVFLVSFEQWNSFNDLNRDPAFETLLKFIDKNKKNISFIFHVLPEFIETDRLARVLNGHVNLERLELTKPELKEAKNFVVAELNKTKIQFTEEAKCKLDIFIENRVNTEAQAYLGYQTLKRLADDLIFEVACMCDEDSEGVRRIDSQIMESLSEVIDFSLDERSTTTKLGFRS